MVQIYGCSSLSQMYRNERQCCCIDGVTSLLWLIVVNNLKNSDYMKTWGFYGLNYGSYSASIYVCTSWSLTHLSWNYFFITNNVCLHKELHNLKAVIFLQRDNWVITSFFLKEGEKLLLKGRLKGRRVVSAVGWAFSILLFSISSCLIPSVSGDLH